jgi:hypothetical protein
MYLERFLAASTPDELSRTRVRLTGLTPDEVSRISRVILGWKESRAVANLLFCPGLIELSLRVYAIDRALRETDAPFLTLAAIVGLQSIRIDEIEPGRRRTWGGLLLERVRAEQAVVANRASVTLHGWSTQPGTSDLLSRYAALYPVQHPDVCRNIIGTVLAVIGSSSSVEFEEALGRWELSPVAVSALRNAHADYLYARTSDGLQAMLMRSPLIAPIPPLDSFAVPQ